MAWEENETWKPPPRSACAGLPSSPSRTALPSRRKEALDAVAIGHAVEVGDEDRHSVDHLREILDRQPRAARLQDQASVVREQWLHRRRCLRDRNMFEGEDSRHGLHSRRSGDRRHQRHPQRQTQDERFCRMRCAKLLMLWRLRKASGRIPAGMWSIFANGQSARAWCRSPVTIAHLGSIRIVSSSFRAPSQG